MSEILFLYVASRPSAGKDIAENFKNHTKRKKEREEKNRKN